MNASLTQFPTVEGIGSVTGAPNLPAGFTDTFTSRVIDTGEVRLHAVIGGSGPAVLLVHGWPETWYAFRHVMLALAENHTVIAVDQRGLGLSDKPDTGYDPATLANDLIGLMDALGHDRFAVVGHDTGFMIGYALASDHPERVERAVLAEIPGAPGTTPAPPLFVPSFLNDKLWHIPFNRVEGLAEQLVAGREDVFFGYEFAVQGGNLPAEAIDYYISLLKNPESLRGSFRLYQVWDTIVAQNTERATRKLTMPILAVGGERSYGSHVAENVGKVAEDVQGAVIAGAGHWAIEEDPEQVLAAILPFLAADREATSTAAAA